jgi:glycosyltransferase involved in cell wall biosynthesis
MDPELEARLMQANSGDLPLVTLITPAYNQADYLAATIESVLAQDYPAIEYIVLDDGSTDRTPEVLKAYDGRVRHERHANMGQSATLNKGWGMSNGVYLGYLSADDLLVRDSISRLVAALEDEQDCVLAYGNFDLIDSRGKVVKKLEPSRFSLRELNEDLICHVGVGALFKREVFDRCGGWNTELRKIPDFEYWLRASNLGSFHHVDALVGLYRVHEESTAVRPVPPARSREITDTMHRYWAGKEQTPSARKALSRAHLMAARSHAQSGRPFDAIGEFVRSIRYQPRTLISRSAWIALTSAFMLRLVNRHGWLVARLR